MSVNSAWSSTKFSGNKSCTNWPVLEPENVIQPLSLFPFLWGGREGDFDFQTLWDSSASLRIFAGEAPLGGAADGRQRFRVMGCWEERIGRFRDKQLFLWKRFCQSFWHTKSPLSPYTMESRQVHSEEPMNLLWLNLLHVYDSEQNCFLFWNNWECKNWCWWLQQVMMERQFAAFYCVSKILESAVFYQQLVALHKAISLSRFLSEPL